MVLTGSRPRGSDVDEFSDPDIELIRTSVLSLYGNDDWLCFLGKKLVAPQPGERRRSGAAKAREPRRLGRSRKIDVTFAALNESPG